MKKSKIHTLYGITHSLYSGRARSYLIKSGIPFRELSTGHESFKAEVLPESKLPTIPVLVTPKGEVDRFALNRISGSELAGACFSPDGNTLFVNIQHQGITVAIDGSWKSPA